MNIKAVLMDIGGVVFINTATEDDFYMFAEKFSEVVGVDPEILNTVRKSYLKESMTGKFSNAQYFAEVAKLSNATLPENIEQLWIQTVAPEVKINQPLLDWVDKTRKHCKIVVFSTVSSLRFKVDEALGVYNHFDDKFLSLELGMTKSNPEFINIALKSLNLTPEETLLIDDQPINISRAIMQGVNGFEYKPYYFNKPELFLAGISAYDFGEDAKP